MTNVQNIYQTISDLAPIGLFTLDEEYRIRYWNDWLAKKTGKDQNKVCGLVLSDIFPGINVKRFNSAIKFALKTRLPQVMSQAFNRYLIPIEIESKRKLSFSFMQQRISISPLVDPDGSSVLIAIEDVTMDVVRSTALKTSMATEEKLTKELKKSLDEINTINEILSISQKNISFKEQQMMILKELLSSKCFQMVDRGAVFANVYDSEELFLAAQLNFNSLPDTSNTRIPIEQCLCKRALQTGSVVFSGSINSRHEATFEGTESQNHYCVPIMIEGRVLGVINLYVKKEHKGTHDIEKLLGTVANVVAPIFTRHEDMKKIEDHERQLDLALRGANLGIWDWDIKTGKFTFNKRWAEMLGYSHEELEPKITTMERLIHPDDMQCMEKAFNDHIEGKTFFYISEYRMRSKDGRWIWILDTGKVFEHLEDGTPLRAVGTHLDITERKVNEEKLKNLTNFDELTGIANRRSYNISIEEEWNRAKRTKTSISTIMMDIDSFKNYNDTLGHAAGDECLRSVAQALKSTIARAGDMVARYGGEEFVAILPGTEIDGAIRFAEKMREKIESLKIPHPDSKVSEYVTISLGVAAIVPDISSEPLPSKLMVMADNRLYQAKEAGRNCVKST